jgi:glycosyltransferase involved in cell wall biosynthesis
MPRIDVVVPCYRYGRYLRQCVASVLDQPLDRMRILIIDNASDDDSVEVARQLAREDSRISLLARQTKLGAQASFNEATDWASGDYLFILCADDLLTPGSLARSVAVLERNQRVAFAIGRELEFRSESDIPADDLKPSDEWRVTPGHALIDRHFRRPARFVAAGTVVVRTALQKRAGHFRPELPYTDDLEMLLRLSLLGDVAETSDIQGLRRLHGANMSAGFLRDRVSDLAHREAAYRSFLAKEGAGLPDVDRLRRRLDGGLAEQAYLWGLRALARGNIREAVNLFGYAVKVRPAIALVPPVHAPFRSDRAIGRFATELLQRLTGAT